MKLQRQGILKHSIGSLWKDFQPLVISVVFILVSIEVLVQQDIINAQIVPPSSVVFKTMWTEAALLKQSFLQTFLNVIYGFVLSGLLGLLLGFMVSLSSFFRQALLPIAIFFQTVPIIALAPLLVIYFGFGDVTVIVSSLIVSIFPILANTITGLGQVRQDHKELFHLYAATPLQTLMKLQLPSAYSSIISGFRVAAGLSVIGTIAGEFVAGGGLGALIDSARAQQRVDLVFACLLLLSFLGLLMLGAVRLTDKIILSWRPLH